jgi:hypothetical protein
MANCSLRPIDIAAGLLTVPASIVVCIAPAAVAGETAAAGVDRSAKVPGSRCLDYNDGVVNPAVAMRYLSLPAGDEFPSNATTRIS